MKFYCFLLVILLFIASCTKDEKAPTFSKDYGSGLYIATSNGVSFYKDGVVKNQIFKDVNGVTLANVNKIKFNGSKAYIATKNTLYSSNVETFENKGEAVGFKNIVDFDFVSMNRIFTTDKEDSKVKVVDMDLMEITSDVETGNNTNPGFIISQWYRSIVLNGGAIPDSLKDSTIVAIDYLDGVVPLADFMGSLEIGHNPNSAVWNGHIKVLCKGVYDLNNSASNTESSLYNIEPWGLENYWDETLNGIYNARNLIESPSSLKFYFLAEGGVYWMPQDASYTTQIFNMESDVLLRRNEWYAINDSTNALSDMLYVNDAVSANNTIYKYNLATSAFCDTIVVDGHIRDINFY